MKKLTTLEPVKLFFAVCVVIALKVHDSTHNPTLAGLAFVCPMLLFLAVQGFRQYIHRRALLESGIAEIDRMSGEAFEQVLQVHFQERGYRVELTPPTGDFGADLILEKAGERLVVQAKRWRDVVGISAVQEIIGALKYYGVSHGMVITNSVFTESAVSLAKANDIDLVDRTKLITLMRKSRSQATKPEPLPEEASRVPEGVVSGRILPESSCPWCGRTLVARSGKHGAFVGCSGFPGCRFTRQG